MHLRLCFLHFSPPEKCPTAIVISIPKTDVKFRLRLSNSDKNKYLSVLTDWEQARLSRSAVLQHDVWSGPTRTLHSRSSRPSRGRFGTAHGAPPARPEEEHIDTDI